MDIINHQLALLPYFGSTMIDFIQVNIIDENELSRIVYTLHPILKNQAGVRDIVHAALCTAARKANISEVFEK